MPYKVVMLKYGPGEGISRPTKQYGNGNGDILSPDEIAVHERVKWLETAIELSVIAPPTSGEQPPVRPYEAQPFNYGVGEGVTLLGKVRPGDYSAEHLSPEETAAWKYLCELESRWEALKQSTTNSSDPPAPTTQTGVPTSADQIAVERFANTPDSQPESQPVDDDSPAAKRVRAIAALLADPGASNGLLSTRANVSDEYIRRIRKELESEGRLQPVTVVARKGGGSYTIANGGEMPESQGVGESVTNANKQQVE